jgi:uncharacterized protein YdcH (DUF465 family)
MEMAEAVDRTTSEQLATTALHIANHMQATENQLDATHKALANVVEQEQEHIAKFEQQQIHVKDSIQELQAALVIVENAPPTIVIPALDDLAPRVVDPSIMRITTANIITLAAMQSVIQSRLDDLN